VGQTVTSFVIRSCLRGLPRDLDRVVIDREGFCSIGARFPSRSELHEQMQCNCMRLELRRDLQCAFRRGTRNRLIPEDVSCASSR
jgi:hypothetical protein